MIRRSRTLPLLMLSLAACSAHAAPREPAADPVLAALRTELGRARSIVLAEHERPYFVSLAVHETERWELGAKLGALVESGHERKREAAVDVRVGSYDLDNSADPERDFMEEGIFEPSSVVPLDDTSPVALRHTLWLLTDLRYKQALASYLRVKGQRVYRLDDPERQPSFSPAPPVRHLAARVALAPDRARWEPLLRRLSARLSTDPEVFDSEVSLEVAVETRWLVTTDGTELRAVRPTWAIHATGWTRAPDGMLLDHSLDLYAPTEAQLPDEATLEAAVDRLGRLLADLRAAPVLEPYTGPAILEGAASGVFFHEVLGHRLEGHRAADDQDGQTFAKYLGQPILPAFLTLLDDPTQPSAAGVPLNGAYAFDDEGVAAARTLLVDRGVLKSFLNARQPGPGADRSNGHGRAQGTRRPVARQANLIVQAHASAPAAELKRRLIEEVRRQGRPFGLIVRDLAGGSTNTSSYGYQAFKGEARTVYKIDVDSGQETLVRGVDLVGTPLATLGKIVAASDAVTVFNGFCGAESGMVPVSVVAPAILFSEVELQRSSRPRARGPLLPSPVPAPRPVAPEAAR
ncbi:MAG: TldD/PmbA family protein [Deltaproteobacteria bacterium]|nr:TldD/PmbA family protein [Deltaproteobacteria bacterium]